MTEILTTDAILTPGGVAPWYGQRASSFQCPSIEAGALSTLEAAFSQRSFLLILASDFPAWIRVYETAAARIADISRPLGVPIQNGMGLVAEVSTSVARLAVKQSPILLFDNGDAPRQRRIYLSVLNRDSVARAPLITITHLPLED